MDRTNANGLRAFYYFWRIFMKSLLIAVLLLSSNLSQAGFFYRYENDAKFSNSLCPGEPEMKLRSLDRLIGEEKNATVATIFASNGEREWVVFGGGEAWEFPTLQEKINGTYSPESFSFYISRGAAKGIYHLYTGNWVTIRHAGSDPSLTYVKICPSSKNDDVDYIEYSTSFPPKDFSYVMIRPFTESEYLHLIEAYITSKPKYISRKFPYSEKWTKDGQSMPLSVKMRIVKDFINDPENKGLRLLLTVDKAVIEKNQAENSTPELKVQDLPFKPLNIIQD